VYNSVHSVLLTVWGQRMYSLLVLGLIPGTNLSITFTVWLVMVMAAISYVVLRSRTNLRLWTRVSPALARQVALPATYFHLRRG